MRSTTFQASSPQLIENIRGSPTVDRQGAVSEPNPSFSINEGLLERISNLDSSSSEDNSNTFNERVSLKCCPNGDNNSK